MSINSRFIVGTGPRAVEVGGPALFAIAGPCVIESRDSALRHAERLSQISDATGIGIIFKSSFDKANRTSGASFRGPGIDEGLAILGEVARATGMPVLTDVHESCQVPACAEACDVLQIPALLSRQTDLIRAAAESGAAVNIKKGQFMAPWDMEHVLIKATDSHEARVMLCERGTSFGYGNLVNDFRALEIMRGFGAPVVFDATHSVQLPSAAGAVSAGERRYIEPLARAAAAVGVHGVFLEVHEDPDHAMSDGPNSLELERLQPLLQTLAAVRDAARGAP